MAQRRQRLAGTVGFLVVMEFGSGLLQGWFSPLLTAIGDHYATSTASLNWVSAVYMLGTVVCVPLLAKLGDVRGHRRMLAVTAVLVAAGSVVVALAPTYTVFLVGRALQAPLAAFLPLEFAIVRDRDEESAGRSVGFLVAALTIGAAVGSVVSGLLFEATGNLGLVLGAPAAVLFLCVPLLLALVPETTARKPGGVDWAGGAMLGVGSLALLGAVANGSAWGWADARTLVAGAAGAGLLAGWYVFERRTADPLVDLRLLRGGAIGLPLLAAFLYGAELYGGQTASFLWIQSDPADTGAGLGMPPGTAGGAILVYALAALAGTLVADRLTKRWGARTTLAVGAGVAAACFGLQIVLSSSVAGFVAAFALGALGNGVVLAALPTVVVRNAPADSVGIASALYNTTRTAAGAVAGAVFALVMSSFATQVLVDGQATERSTPAAFVAVWAISGVLTLVMLALVTRVRVTAAAADAPPAAHGVAVAEEGAS